MTAARMKPASNYTLQRTTGSRCSPLAAERARWAVVAEARKKVRRTKDQVLGDEWREEA